MGQALRVVIQSTLEGLSVQEFAEGEGVLTPEASALLERRREQLESIVSDSKPVTEEFIRAVVGDVTSYLTNLELFLPVLDTLLRDEEILDDEARVELQMEVMYFLGEYLLQRFGGRWTVDDLPMSPTFAHYVVDIPIGRVGAFRVSLAAIAGSLVKSSPPRSLYALIDPILKEIASRRRVGTDYGQ